MKIILNILLLFIVSLPCVSRNSPVPAAIERVRTLTLTGLEYAYNCDFISANEHFDKAIAQEPLHPRPYVGKTFVALWQFLLSNNNKEYESVLSIADRSIEAGERYMEKYGEDAEVLTCLGTAYGYRAFAHGRSKSYLKAAWDGKKSYDYFYNALKADPHSYDAYLGIGMFHYFTAFISTPLRWIVSILGIHGDTDLGIKELRIASEKGVYSKVEAQYILAQFIPWQEGDFSASEHIINNLLNQYPENSLLRFTLAAWQIRRNDITDAKEHLTAILQKNTTSVGGVLPFAQYKLAECCFRLADFDQAITHYKLFLYNYRDEMYQATSNYRIGISYELLRNRDSALQYYKRAIASSHSFGDDEYSARKAAHFLKTPPSDQDTMLLHAQNTLKCGDYELALKLFSPLTRLNREPHDLALEAYYCSGEALFEQGKYPEALSQFQMISSGSPKDELWLLPWSHYHIALCYLKLNKTELAHKAFDKVLEYDNYDFKNWLAFRTERELSKIN